MVFLRNLDQLLTGRFGIGLSVFKDLDISINQLPVQSYMAVTVCTIAFLPFFKLMVNTAPFVNHRKLVSKINGNTTGIITSAQNRKYKW